MIVGLLLAAGSSRRFGAQKLTVPIAGVPVLAHAAKHLGRLVNQVFAIVPQGSAELEAILQPLGARIVVNPSSAEGIASSIRAGVEALPHGITAVLIALGDEPRPDRDAAKAVVRRWRQHRDAIVVPRYQGVAGHPVLFAHEVFAELTHLEGDVGAKSIIDRDPHRVTYLDFDRPAPPDIDTKADLAQFSDA